uniref:Uncharacterized protein n=1 Tax=Sphaerodactylus townsendi TaxID=933632 RepID=A0ACB8F1Q5_9SAUR
MFPSPFFAPQQAAEVAWLDTWRLRCTNAGRKRKIERTSKEGENPHENREIKLVGRVRILSVPAHNQTIYTQTDTASVPNCFPSSPARGKGVGQDKNWAFGDGRIHGLLSSPNPWQGYLRASPSCSPPPPSRPCKSLGPSESGNLPC